MLFSTSNTIVIVTSVFKTAVFNINNSYTCIVVMPLDVSKAFRTVQRSTLLEKMGELDIPDYVNNWLVDFLEDIYTALSTVDRHRQ